MGLFNMFKTYDINESLKEFKKTDDAILLDVREKDEYQEGHIPQAINLPLTEINKVEGVIKDKDKKIFIYCLSGARSSKAEKYLNNRGYKNTENIGGIMDYDGKIEK